MLSLLVNLFDMFLLILKRPFLLILFRPIFLFTYVYFVILLMYFSYFNALFLGMMSFFLYESSLPIILMIRMFLKFSYFIDSFTFVISSFCYYAAFSVTVFLSFTFCLDYLDLFEVLDSLVDLSAICIHGKFVIWK
jgi:hypothetical protein